jgi:DNA polymerase-3 subunit gamma/tau
MTGQVFYRKWRPQTLSEVVGQEHVTTTLLNALKAGRLSHAYLFCGPRGTGKTSTGRILAKAVNCLTNKGQGEPCNECDMCRAITEGRSLDIIEIDAASNTGVDDIRELKEKVGYSPGQAARKVYIIDEVHMLSTSASNALLKTLEEPPPHVIFILATTEAHKILPTLISRCQRFDFHRITQSEIAAKLEQICRDEGVTIAPEALQLISRSATGSLRDAENLIEQLTTYYGAEIGLEQAQAMLGLSGDARSREMVEHIINCDAAAAIKTLSAVSDDGLDLKQFNRELVSYLRELLLVKAGSDAALSLSKTEKKEMQTLASKTSLGHLLKAVKSFSALGSELDSSNTLPLELALVDVCMDDAQTAPAKAAPAEAPPAKPATKPTHTAPPPPPPTPEPKPAAAVSKPVEEKPGQAAEAPLEEPMAEVAPEETPGAEAPPPEKPKAKAKAEAPAEAAPKKEAAAPLSDDGLDYLGQNWTQVIEEAPESTRRTPALAILRSAGVYPVAFSDGTVTLAFRHSYHKDKIDQPENKKVVVEIISHFLGRPCQVNCIFEKEANHLVQEAQKMGAQLIDVEE